MPFYEERKIKESTQINIGNHFTKVAKTGLDVQEFDPDALYGGTKKSLALQKGFYRAFNTSQIYKLAIDLKTILESNHEYEILNFLGKYKQALTSKEPLSDFPNINSIKFLPEFFFDDINPEDMVAPNGLRIPETIVQPNLVSHYSAKLLVPKLLLASINGLQGMVPWTDVDMDLNSTIHAMRPDPGKNEINSGYGGGSILHHTDGYWNEASNVPLLVVVMAVTNPFQEPTSFIPIKSIFQILSPSHSLYSEWANVFSNLLKPQQTPLEFVRWVIREAQKPQFSFVMGSIGGDASRGVYEVPLLEYFHDTGKYLFRAKSTFYSENKEAQSVVCFVNQMLEYLAKSRRPSSYHEKILKPGEIYFALNGSDMQIDLDASYGENDIAYPVNGLGCVHGRYRLKSENKQIKRTLMRGNSLLSLEDSALIIDNHLPINLDNNRFIQPIQKLLTSGFRGNDYCR